MKTELVASDLHRVLVSVYFWDSRRYEQKEGEGRKMAVDLKLDFLIKRGGSSAALFRLSCSF